MKFLIVNQSKLLLVSTAGDIWRTVWIICILILGCEGLRFRLVLFKGF